MGKGKADAKTPRIDLLVIVKTGRKPADLDPDDRSLPGEYLIRVDEDLDEGQRAKCALDIFHESQGIEVLDDFDVTVVDAATRKELSEDSSHGNLSHRGDYVG